MIDRQPARGLLFYIAMLGLLLLGQPAAAQQVQGERTDLRVTAVDSAPFPTVKVRVLATAAGNAPVGDLTRLVLRENGVPIPDTTTAQTPVGADIILVVDANADFLLFDDRSGLSRRDKLAAGISRYAEQFMNPAGLDRVSILVPDETGTGAAFLVTDAGRPSEVADAINAYNPATTSATPLQAMMVAAIEHLASSEDGRFQGVLLYTDGARLSRQLDYPALVEAALAARIPLYVAILGAEASAEEIANATGLYDPTNGLYVHMPEPEAADPIYAIFQAQGQQAELAYESALRQNGTHQVSVSLGNVRDTTEFELLLAAPEVSIEPPPTPVRRAGSAVDTPLELLQPAVLPLTVRVNWPDGRPRQLTEVVFQVDGAAQPLAIMPAVDAAGTLPVPWDISGKDAGTYRLEIAIADDLGFRAAAEPLDVVIEVARPSPPTPTPTPTRAPSPTLGERLDGPLLPGLLVLALAAGGALVWLRRRAARPAPAEETSPQRIVPAADPRPADGHVAVLTWQAADGSYGEQIELTTADVTIGRDAEAVDIIIEEPSISRLHARIRRAANGQYWLYDEGSTAGTFLNYERLALAPKPLQHNDVVQLGRVTLRFRLELPAQGGEAPQVPDDAA
jgi:hypothetical protein